jgi:hypothetical protein
LIHSLFAGLFDGHGRSIGALAAAAAAVAYAADPDQADTIRQFVLLGDPVLVFAGSPSSSAVTYLPYAGRACATARW